MEKMSIEFEGKIFRKIHGYENYFVSSCGDVLSLANREKKLKILQPMVTDEGYAYVYLYNAGGSKKVYIHHAVLYAWVGDRPKGYEGRHLDDDNKNNDYRNLAWGTHQQNMNDRRKNKGFSIGEKSGSAKVTEEQVLEILNMYRNGKSSRDIGEQYKISHTQVLKIVKGKDWSHLPFDKSFEHHSSKRKTPMRDFEIKRGTENLKRYSEEHKKERQMIPCACGCGTLICSVNKYGRNKKYAQGHNQRGKHWRWENDKD